MKPRLLDLFCGAGGASVGYARAGFEVVGVDIRPQPHYPYSFEQGDVFSLVSRNSPWFRSFDAIHASPPCQAFTQMSARWRGKGTKADTHPNLIPETRDLLERSRVPWVMENVIGATGHLHNPLTLHGGQFGLGVYRPRLFESSALLLSPGKFPKPPFPIGVYGTKPDGHTTYRYRNNGNMKGKSLIRTAKSVEEAQAVMGIDWMPEWDELRESIPPAYTEWIGRQLIQALEVAA